MNKTTISLTVAAALAVFGAQVVHARGFGGAHAGGGASAGGSHGSSYHGGSQSGGYHGSSESGAYHGSSQSSASHGSSESGAVPTAAVGRGVPRQQRRPARTTAAVLPQKPTTAPTARPLYTAPRGPPRKAPREMSMPTRRQPAARLPRRRAAPTYAARHRGLQCQCRTLALPTDAGYGMSAARTGTAAYAGYHQTEAVSGSVAAARGAAVRTAFNAPGLYGQDWHAANPGAWAPAGWTAGRAWATTAWPAVGASLGWGSVQPIAYNYGTNITYQDNQVYYGDQAVATAGEYYQQAAALAASAPAPAAQSADWLPLGVFALVQKEQSDPHYVMQLAVNKSGALAGNYSDLLSGTTSPDSRSRGQKDAASRLDDRKQQDDRRRNGALQPDPGRGAGVDPHRQGQDPAVAAGPPETTGTVRRREVIPIGTAHPSSDHSVTRG